MKKLFLLVACAFVAAVSFAQTGRADPGGGSDGGGIHCPAGTHLIYTYACPINFHKPRTNCTSGFGFCIVNCQWSSACVIDGYSRTAGRESQTNVVGEYVNGKFEIHFPKAAISQSLVSATDQKTFTLDEALQFVMNGVRFELVPGDYKTVETSYEVIVPINTKLL